MLQAIAHGGRHLRLLKSTVQHVGMRFNKGLRLLGGDDIDIERCALLLKKAFHQRLECRLQLFLLLRVYLFC